MADVDLGDRLFDFAKKVIFLSRSLPEKVKYKTIRYQTLTSSGSSGANYEAAQSGSSTADFVHKIENSLREMRESNYWLRLISEVSADLSDHVKSDLEKLIDESNQLKKI